MNLASVQKVLNVTPIEGADAIETAHVLGWQVVIKKGEYNVGVLVFIPGEDNHITSGMWDIDNKWVLLDEYRVPDCEVTHWMPLPGLPEGREPHVIPDWFADTIRSISRDELGLDESAGEKETPDWVAWLSDRSPSVPDLSNSTQEEKQLLVNTLFQACGGQFMKMFYAIGLKTHMETGMVNDSTGDLFRLRFELLQQGGQRKSWKERLAEEKAKQLELPPTPVDLEPGTKFRNIHMPGFTFFIRDMVQAANVLSVLIVDDLNNDNQRIERDWNLQHTYWAFEKGEYYLPQ